MHESVCLIRCPTNASGIRLYGFSLLEMIDKCKMVTLPYCCRSFGAQRNGQRSRRTESGFDVLGCGSSHNIVWFLPLYLQTAGRFYAPLQTAFGVACGIRLIRCLLSQRLPPCFCIGMLLAPFLSDALTPSPAVKQPVSLLFSTNRFFEIGLCLRCMFAIRRVKFLI